MLDDRAAPISDAARSVACHGGIGPPGGIGSPSATASRCSAISHGRSAGRQAKPCSPMSRALGEESEKADHDGSKRLDKRQAPPFQRGSPG